MERMARVLMLTIAVAAVALPARAEVGQHCAYRLVPVSRSGTLTSAEPELIGCYPTYGEALEAGTGGAIEVTAEVSPLTLTDEQSYATAGSDVLIGTEYADLSYVGASNSYFASVTCSASVTWEVSWVGSTWNDTFSSGKGFGGCNRNKKFEHADFGGNVRTCTPNCASYQALANEVSSLRWKD